MKFTFENCSKIKLIIWDLDETFWNGTLSDHGTEPVPVPTNCELVRKLAARGIISAVCSKNDKKQAEDKLRELRVADYFVFNSIDWNPKGPRIQRMISDMALRPSNVLFLDDNASNLAEAEFVMPELMVASPSIIPELFRIADALGKHDSQLSRLKQYKILEEKRKDAQEYLSNYEFLKSSNIKIVFKNLCHDVIGRIAELIQRSNQLNFTKKRIGEAELVSLMNDENYKLGYVTVFDDYGKYGIVGFYALDKKANKLEHFLFSCRTMGMGIEQYVYATLGYPDITIVEPVSGNITRTEGAPDYIERMDPQDEAPGVDGDDKRTLSVLLKGPCDLEVMASYIEGGDVLLDKEFNFVDNNGNQADYFNHLVNILSAASPDKDFIDGLCGRFSFVSKEAFRTQLFSGKYDVICLSPLMDATLAVFSDDKGDEFAYGLYSKPLSERKYHKEYLDKQIMTARNSFAENELERFSREFRQIDYTPEMIAENLYKVIDLVRSANKNTVIVILLLAELPYTSDDPRYLAAFSNKDIIHKAINDEIRKRFSGMEYMYLLDVNKYIRSQSDYFDHINHYSKYVYFEMAQEFRKFMETLSSANIKTSSRLKAAYQNIKRMIYKKIFVR